VSGILKLSSGAATSGSSGALLIGTGASKGGCGGSLDLTVGSYFFRHNVLNTLILVDQRCRMTCTESYAIELHGKARLNVVGLRVYYGYIAVLLNNACASTR
jgi:hypothetical protein